MTQHWFLIYVWRWSLFPTAKYIDNYVKLCWIAFYWIQGNSMGYRISTFVSLMIIWFLNNQMQPGSSISTLFSTSQFTRVAKNSDNFKNHFYLYRKQSFNYFIYRGAWNLDCLWVKGSKLKICIHNQHC